ncbi:hypothetical protein, partial [Actinobacillus pleuropneumoniae]|uniref:hypothetical protein n=1 Tax=Actinobacillus pleuropneumoniae TaxID=715 RepID=UPI00227B36E8
IVPCKMAIFMTMMTLEWYLFIVQDFPVLSFSQVEIDLCRQNLFQVNFYTNFGVGKLGTLRFRFIQVFSQPISNSP